jgi:nonsense-mediated mRNA decay protein 3
VIEISLKGRFCAVCGKKEGPFLDNMCENCYKRENPLEIKIIPSLDIEICPSCGTIFVSRAHIDTWSREESLEEIIREISKSKIIEKINVDFSYNSEFEDDIEESKIMNYGVKFFTMITTITAKPYKEFGEFIREGKTRLKMVRQSCDDCSKYKSGYFEAILQVRGENRKLTEKEEEEIENLIEKMMKQYEDARLAYILDLEVDNDGITANVSTKFLAETIAREIKNFTAGKLTVAYEHKTTSKDGTEVYTNTYLVRLPEFAVNDIIEYENQLWQVKNINENQVKMENLENHLIKNIDRKRVENRAKKRNDEIILREYMLVSKENETVTIMAMDNYENFDDNLERIPPKKKDGEILKGFLLEDRNYYVE